ncbi:hypothetical protein QN277_000279 [Acacia crassicarpa]|uniref:F-box domain-containing protein n=1 Tax=Acacia crassicarpa TaxID=499986 RepID=A0AAE1N4W1_9FABA|nr:hypothetical protein QN277_000279 [Acacia crassicarpa]
MGLKRRKLSTKKTKKKLKPRNSLSNLPDEILHHILSFLKLRDIARLRVLSKKFQTLSATAPSFCFSERRPSFWFSKPRFRHRRNCSCAHVFNFMNTLPQHRSHSLKIKRISFKSFCDKGEHSSLHDHWINNLFQTFHVEQLSLNYQLPSIFTSLPKFQSLKLLKLEMNRVIMVKLPEMKLTSLETLHIMFFATEDPVGEWVSQSFPALKSLFLSEINVSWLSKKLLDLEIRSSCLEALSIQKCCSLKPVRIITENLRTLSYVTCPCVRCHHNDDIVDFRYDDSVFEISAPNLRRLSWQGYAPRLCYDARTFQSLQVASFTKLSLQNLNLTIQLFEATRRATSLHTDTGMIKVSS